MIRLLARAFAGSGAQLPLALFCWALAGALLIVDALDSGRGGGAVGVVVAALLVANGVARLWFRRWFGGPARS